MCVKWYRLRDRVALSVGGAIVVGAIVFGVLLADKLNNIVITNWHGGITTAGQLHAKFSCASGCSWKNIAVANRTPNVSVLSAFLYSEKIVSVNLDLSSGGERFWHHNTWHIFPGETWKCPIIWKWVISSLGIYVDQHVHGWSCASIFKDRSNAPPVMALWVQMRKSFYFLNSNVSSQLTNRDLVHGVYARRGSLCTNGSGIGRLLSKEQTVLHKSGLSVHRPPLEIAEYSNSKSGERGNDGASDEPPWGRRFVIALYSEMLLIPGCYYGSKLIDSRSQFLGCVIIGTAFALFGFSLFLICVSGFT